MRFYKKTNVLEDAKKRISFLFDEFEVIVVGFSGGKDSNVIFHLAMEEAKKRKRLPLKVMFIDQEAEWTFTIDVIKDVMYRKEVEPYWFQMPIKLFNATTYNEDNWLYCWREGDEWLREKDKISIKENNCGSMRFHKLFGHILRHYWKGKKTALLGGVRTEESPSRFMALTSSLTYKHITWGKKNLEKNHFTFYPIYDWSYTDVWKYINDNEIKYNKIYDYQYRHGESIQNMRVSNLHHETAIYSLFYMHEVEPELHEKLLKRLPGIHSAIKYKDEFNKVKKLPYMFKDWKEYRDFLLEKLIPKGDRKVFENYFHRFDIQFKHHPKYKNILKSSCSAIIKNDRTGTILKNLYNAHDTKELRRYYNEQTNGKNKKTVEKEF